VRPPGCRLALDPDRYAARVITVGLTGGIGSGKSEVARLLARRGAVLVDADALAREAVASGSEGLARVVAEFGTEILAADGSLDRPKLAQIVFGDADRLATLNAIVHPYVGRRSAEMMAAAAADAVVVYDVPLLVENQLEQAYDVVVVVDVSPETQVDRLTRIRGMAQAEAEARMAAQATRDQRLAAADVVIDNDGELVALTAQADALWERLSGGPPV
jgi:dephospho-CoA kinase